VSSQAHKQVIGHLKVYVKKNNFTRKKPLPVPAMAMSKPRAMSCELTCSQSRSMKAQNSFGKNKFNNKNTTAGAW
jgi:hypothetical protein